MAIVYRPPRLRLRAIGVDKDPVGTQPHITAATGGLTSDEQARAAIDAIRDLLATFGLMEPA